MLEPVSLSAVVALCLALLAGALVVLARHRLAPVPVRAGGSRPGPRPARRSLRDGAVAAVALALVLMGIAIPPAARAAATSDGVTLTVSYGGESLNGTPVVTPGSTYIANLAYDLTEATPGSSVTLTAPDGVTFPTGVPSGNTNIASITQTGNEVVVTFADSFSGEQQGFIDLTFTFDDPGDGSLLSDVTWSLDSAEDTQTIIIKDPDSYDPPPTNFATQLHKGVDATGFAGAVTYDPATEAVTVAGGRDITAAGALTYTLTVDIAQDSTFALSDILDDRLDYDPASFAATLTTWSATGDKTPSPFQLGDPAFADNGFAIDPITVAAPAILTLTYTAHVRDTAIPGIVAALKDGDGTANSPIQGVAEVNSETGGDIWVDFANTADTTVTDEAAATARLGRHVDAEAQPNVDPAFGKNLTSPNETVLNPEGATEDGAPVLSELPLTTTYTLTANLGAFRDANNAWLPKWDLTDDVVLRDQLPAGMVWDQAAVAANPGLTLLDAADVPASLTEDTFAAAADPGEFWIDAATRTLWVNLGSDTSRTWSINVATVLLDAAALAQIPTWNKNDPQVSVAYYLANQANYFYWDGRSADEHAKHQVNKDAPHRDLYVAPDAGSVIEDAKAFDKTMGELGQMTSGEAYPVPFTFTFGAGAIVDLAESVILDHVNHRVFDVTEETLPAIRDSLSGSYDGRSGLSGDDFDLSIDADTGDLVIVPAEGFGADLAVPPTAPMDRALVLHLDLPTHVIQGKQTLDVSNSATVQGGTKTDYEWVSTATGSATSYGDELEVQKSVYGGDDAWTQNLRVQIGDDGLPVQSEFIYRVELNPHGNFGGHAILNIVDILPPGTSLLGFVDDDALEDGDVRADGAMALDIEGNLHVALDAGANTVVVSQQPDTVLPAEARPHVNFKVRIDAFADLAAFVADLGVTNRIGPNQATITPTNGFPLQIVKTDARRPDVTITDRDARFAITGPDGEVITDEAYVVDGQLMVADADGADHGIVIPAAEPTIENPDGVPAGRYCITEVVAPEGYDLPEPAVRCHGGMAHAAATIGDDGSSEAVAIADEPQPLYAIGDYTWIDSDRDGVQDADEPILPGVTVELLDPNDEDAVLATTWTDANGHYQFDLLPAGQYRVRFTLTDEQAADYTFTEPRRGGDAVADSDADPATGESGVITLDETNTHLVPGASYPGGDVRALNGIDPTWDAGVVQKTYAIGDYTWIDSDRDGAQDADEPVLPGVSVELLDGAGNRAKHIDGTDVLPVTTDPQGRYLFDELPAGDYRVTFTLTEDQSRRYVFTTTGGGAAGSVDDSDAVVADAAHPEAGITRAIALGPDDAALTTTYPPATVRATEGIDPTWDAGVVARTYAIGDYTWIDSDGDGVQDPDEPVLPEVIVELLNPDGTPVLDGDGEPVTTSTDEHGRYLFDELPAGDYRLRFTLTDEQERLYRFTGQDADAAGTDPDADSDADPTTGLTETVTLGPDNPTMTTDYDRPVKATNGIDPTWDAGVVRKTYAVGDYTWIDVDRDGVQDADEPVLAGVTVTLLDGVTGAELGVTVTDADGRYQFDDLLSGTYRLRFALTDEQAAQYTFTDADVDGADDAADSDAERDTGLTAPFTLDDDSPLVSGDDYLAEHPGADEVSASEGIDPRWDAGVVRKTYAVGDYTWIDVDRDGVQDADEPVLAGVTVTLLDGVTGAELGVTVTDADGRYLFDELPAGDYQLRFALTPEQAQTYRFTDADAGADGADSDAAPASGLTAVFALGDGNANLTTRYRDQNVRATQGIDPTWDAGVVTIALPPTPGDPADPAPLALTGASTATLLDAALLALLIGLGLVLAGSRRGAHRAR